MTAQTPAGQVGVLPVRLPRDHHRDELAAHRLLGVPLEVIGGALRLPEVLVRLEARLRRLLAELVEALLVEVAEQAREVLHDVLAVRERLLRPLERRSRTRARAVDRRARRRPRCERATSISVTRRSASDFIGTISAGPLPLAVDEVQARDRRVARPCAGWGARRGTGGAPRSRRRSSAARRASSRRAARCRARRRGRVRRGRRSTRSGSAWRRRRAWRGGPSGSMRWM